MADNADDVVKLEGMIATVTVIKPTSTDLAAISRAVRSKIESLPDFFDNAAVAIDLTDLDGRDPIRQDEEAPPLSSLSLAELTRHLRELGLLPLGVRGLRQARVQEAQHLGLPPLGGPSVRRRGGEGRSAEPAPAIAGSTLTLQQPLRGGRVAYAKGGDAIVLSSVNAGGELIADGNIHVYGALRGRALAGAHGDESARIFCQSLEAELLAVAGVYLRADELPEARLRKPAQIYREGESLVVAAL